MMQFLRLHARKDDFVQTVAKARRFAEAQEAARPKMSVWVVETQDRDHSAEVAQPEQPNFQPLIDGFQKVIQTVLDRTQTTTMASVGVTGDETRSLPKPGKFSVVPKSAR